MISQLSQLKLYLGGSFRQSAVEELGEEASKACLFELKSLSRLVILCVELENMACFPTNLYLDNLPKFEISIGCSSIQCYPKSSSLYLIEIEILLTDEVKALFKKSEEASLSCLIEDSLHVIDPSGSNGLKSLKVSSCNNMFTLQNTGNLPAILTNLEELHIKHMGCMLFIFGESILPSSLQKLRILKVRFCKKTFTILRLPLILLLQNLEEVTVEYCEEVIWIFHLPQVCEETCFFLNPYKVGVSTLVFSVLNMA